METISIGKGEAASIIVTITDNIEYPIHKDDDMLLFAIKRHVDDKDFLFHNLQKFSNMTYDVATNVYTNIIEILSKDTIQWQYGEYWYDWTLIKGTERFPQTEPAKVIVTPTVGASGKL